MRSLEQLHSDLNVVRTHKRIIETHFSLDDIQPEEYQKLQEKDDIITDIINNFNSLAVRSD